MTADGVWLKDLWPNIKLAMQCLIKMDKGDGLLDGHQWNTLDAGWFGQIAWLSGLYLASLRATAEMAADLGDDAFAAVDGHAIRLRVWVDALKPVVHIEGQSDSPLEAAVSVEYPTGLAMAPHHPGQTYGPLVREGRLDGDSIEWWERSPAIDEGRNEYIRRFHVEEIADLLPNPMANRTMGGRLYGAGLVADGTGQGTYDGGEFKSVQLKSAKPLQTFDLRAALRIAQDPTLEEWQAQVKKLEAAQRATAPADWQASAAWWQGFWDRSRIVINPGKGPDDPAWQAGRNYQLFRALLASNRTGEFPTLFNGGPFTCEPNPDRRNWFDCQFMAQNQRLVYWPMHLYGVGRPGLELARDTWEFSFEHPRQKRNFC